MKKLALFLAAAAMARATFAVPSAAVTGLTVDPDSGEVVVAYSLTDGPAIVTAAFSADGVAVPERNATRLRGDVNKKVTGASGEIRWDVLRDCPTLNVAALGVTLTVWPCDNPPDYMAVDLRQANVVRYYVSTNALPEGGLDNNLYRTGVILMRKIPAAGVTWKIGSPSSEVGHAQRDVQYWVTFTQNYYMGVYELTQQQMQLIGGSNNGYFVNTASGPALTNRFGEVLYTSTATVPSAHTYAQIRGTKDQACWPEDGSTVGASSPLKYLRDLTGVQFDLPTDAQWEYACRAGTGTTYYSGENATVTSGVEPVLEPLAWYNDNTADMLLGPRPVGLKQPNPWGLYDMIGNIFEWTLDWYHLTPYAAGSSQTDPVGPATADGDGKSRISRGGAWNQKPQLCRTAYRQNHTYNAGKNYTGSRLCCPVTAP